MNLSNDANRYAHLDQSFLEIVSDLSIWYDHYDETQVEYETYQENEAALYLFPAFSVAESRLELLLIYHSQHVIYPSNDLQLAAVRHSQSRMHRRHHKPEW